MKVDGRLQGSALPAMWRFGEWVTGGEKVYKVTHIDLGIHQLKKESDLVDVKETIGKQFLKVLCRITLLPFLFGWIAKQSYRSRFTLMEEAPTESFYARPIKTQSITPNHEKANATMLVSTQVKEVAGPLHEHAFVRTV